MTFGSSVHGKTFWHDASSLKEIWRQLGEEAGTHWECEACLNDWVAVGYDEEDMQYLGHNSQVLRFSMRRMR